MLNNPAAPVCIFRCRIIQSPWAGHSVPAFKPTSKTRQCHLSSCLSPSRSSRSIPAAGETKLGSNISPWGLWPDLGAVGRTPYFSCCLAGRKTLHFPARYPVYLFTMFSCSPGFPEIAGKSSSSPAPAIAAHAPSAWRRLQLLGGTAAALGDGEVRKAEPGSVSSLCACERGMHSPCSFPGPPNALAAPRLGGRA